MLLARVVDTSREVAATRSRVAKISAIADLFAGADPDTAGVIAGFLAGTPRQGRVGVGWATVSEVDGGAASEPTVTVDEVDTVLEAIPTITGAGSQAERTTILGELFRRTTASEHAFLKALLTGEMRHGALEGSVIEAIARAGDVHADIVRRAVMLSDDTARVTRLALSQGVEGLMQIGLSVGTPIRPMLAATSPDVASALTDIGGDVVVDWKLDGARIQVHRTGPKARVFSRNGNEVSDRLPAVVSSALALDCSTVVLDGEALAVGSDGRPARFADTMSGFGSDDGGGRLLRPYYFDILHLDGVDLIDERLATRLAALDRVVPAQYRVPRVVTDDAGAAVNAFEEAIEAGHEGVVVKDAGSQYAAGRRGSAWRKVKPVKSLDLVVLAAEWGHGRRTGWLSNIHLGARDANGDFVMVGKTFKGMTDQLLTWQTERFLELEERRTANTVFLRPHLVVEIALDGVVASPRYPGGVALRFARVKQYREDKDPAEADTIEAVRSMYEGSTTADV